MFLCGVVTGVDGVTGTCTAPVIKVAAKSCLYVARYTVSVRLNTSGFCVFVWGRAIVGKPTQARLPHDVLVRLVALTNLQGQ